MLSQIKQTSSLTEIREFLCRERCALPPWGAPSSAVEALYALLAERRDDDRFWAELKDLARRLEDRRFNPLAISGCEVLSHVTLDQLIDDLRAELGGCGGDRSRCTLREWLSNAVGAAALTGFLVLGTAVGCDDTQDSDLAADAGADTGADADTDTDTDTDLDTDTDTDTDTDADTDADTDTGGDADGDTDTNTDTSGALCPDAVLEEMFGVEGEVYCDLIDIVNTANISAQVRATLLDCLPDLDAEYRSQLLATFETMTDADLAIFLNAMASPTGICGDPGGDSDTDSH